MRMNTRTTIDCSCLHPQESIIPRSTQRKRPRRHREQAICVIISVAVLLFVIQHVSSFQLRPSPTAINKFHKMIITSYTGIQYNSYHGTLFHRRRKYQAATSPFFGLLATTGGGGDGDPSPIDTAADFGAAIMDSDHSSPTTDSPVNIDITTTSDDDSSIQSVVDFAIDDRTTADASVEQEKISSQIVIDSNKKKEVTEKYEDEDDVDFDDSHQIVSNSTTPFFASPVTTVRRDKKNQTTAMSKQQQRLLSRRSAFEYGAILFGGALFTGAALDQIHLKNQAAIVDTKPKQISFLPEPVLKPKPKDKNTAKPKTSANTKAPFKKVNTTATSKTRDKAATQTQPPKKVAPVSETGRLEPVNLTQVASETNINVTLDCKAGCISVDSKNFTKVKKAKLPGWYPSWLAPNPKVVKEITNSELLVASVVAGAVTEMARTSLLYPLQTIKTRIQADQHNFTRRPLPLTEKVKTLGTNIPERIKEGNLYAGIKPTLLVSVPATGIYYGVRDVTKRMLSMTAMGDTTIAVTGAFMGDVVSLCFRTPADTLALRLQAQNETVGDWLGDSLARIPMVIATDLPYLLSKVILNRLFIHGSLSVDKYAEFAVFTAIVAAFLSTPFDVARTRILLDKQLVLEDDEADEDEETNTVTAGEDADEELPSTPEVAKTRPGYSVLQTMTQIMNEGEGGVANLFAGWLERVFYLGIGRAWLEPVQLIGYIGIRDFVLLEWF